MKQTRTDWINDAIEKYLIKLLISSYYEILQLKLDDFKIKKNESPKLANIGENYHAKISKGIRLSKYVKLK